MQSTPQQAKRAHRPGRWVRWVGAGLVVAGVAVLLASTVAPRGSSPGGALSPFEAVHGEVSSRLVAIETTPNAYLSYDVVADRATGWVHLTWDVDPAALAPRVPEDIVGYEVWIDGEGQRVQVPHSGTDASVALPWQEAPAYEDLHLELRLVVRFDDAEPLTLPPTDRPPLPWVLPALAEVPVHAERWSAGSTEVLVTDAQRVAEFGPTAAWTDGNIGFTAIDGTVHGFAANGEDVSRWEVDPDGFVDAGSLRGDDGYDGTAIEIVGDDNPYAAGGPVYLDEGDPADAADDQLLMLYHGEVWHDVDRPEDGFWGYIGMARSTDDGRTWTSLGPVIEPEMDVRAMEWPDSKEIGGAPYVVRTDPTDGRDYLYVYFRDTDETQRPLNLSVARAPLRAALASARDGVAPTFEKWDGAWTGEPGLGGTSTDLLAGQPTPRWWDVTYLDLDDEAGSDIDRGLYVLAYSDNSADGRWTTLVRTSPDGIEWSDPERVTALDGEDELVYLSLSSPAGKGSQRHVEGDTVDLYRVRSDDPLPDRWAAASIERVPLTFVGTDVEGS